MINFLASYDSENEEDDEKSAASRPKNSNANAAEDNDDDGSSSGEHSESSPVGPGSILNRHHRVTTVSSIAIAARVQAVVVPQEEEPLELLGESPEFEAHRRAHDDDEEDDQGNVDSIDNRKRAVQSKPDGDTGEDAGERIPSADSSEPPEKKPLLADQKEGEGDKDAEEHGGEVTAADEEASSLARSMIGKISTEISIPPEPTAQCSRHLQDRIVELLEYTKKTGTSFVAHAEKSKSFRNPSIYEKLIQFCKIDENGTNFPPEIYNPFIWGKESYYEELGKVQRQEMERREKERSARQKHDGLSAVPASGHLAISASSIARRDDVMLGSMEERKKSKWDSAGGVQHGHQASAAGSGRPVVQVLSGTKVIPATGALGIGFSTAFGNKHH